MAVNPDVVDARQRRKPGRLFFITISLVSEVEGAREHLLSLFDDLVSYCVALERSSSKSKAVVHLHAFLEFNDNLLVEDLREYLVLIYDTERVNIQPCRSKRSCVKYISKEDVGLLTNIKVSDLNFNYQLYCWASSVDKFDFTDPFVVQHRFCYRFVKQYFDDFKFHEGNVFKGFNRVEGCWHNWSMDVCIWWNKYYNFFKIKRPCLYLYGPGNVGKSTFIENLIGRNNLKYVFYPGVGKFFMQGFREGYHRLILFEEFDMKFFSVALLKRLLEGRPYAYPVKCEPDKIITFTGPIIFVSNYDEIVDEALRSRLYFVSAGERYWEAGRALVPKAEAAVAEDVIAVSDEEETPVFAEASGVCSKTGESVSSELFSRVWEPTDDNTCSGWTVDQDDVSN